MLVVLNPLVDLWQCRKGTQWEAPTGTPLASAVASYCKCRGVRIYMVRHLRLATTARSTGTPLRRLRVQYQYDRATVPRSNYRIHYRGSPSLTTTAVVKRPVPHFRVRASQCQHRPPAPPPWAYLRVPCK